MRTLDKTLVLSLALIALPAMAQPTQYYAAEEEETYPDETAQAVEAPQQLPPPAPARPPSPPVQRQAAQAPSASGQWVHTQQYGWIWMPYGDDYTYAPLDGESEPYEYVYYPTYGWTWVVAPWVWGWGPWPYFGSFGPRHFGWWGHGWWRTPERWHSGAGFRGGFARHFGSPGFVGHGGRAFVGHGGFAGHGGGGFGGARGGSGSGGHGHSGGGSRSSGGHSGGHGGGHH